MPSFDLSPIWVWPDRSVVVLFRGVDTTWGTDTPTFTPSGVVGVSASTAVISSDTLASVLVTYGSSIGVVTWTDSTTGATANQIVSMVGKPKLLMRRS